MPTLRPCAPWSARSRVRGRRIRRIRQPTAWEGTEMTAPHRIKLWARTSQEQSSCKEPLRSLTGAANIHAAGLRRGVARHSRRVMGPEVRQPHNSTQAPVKDIDYVHLVLYRTNGGRQAFLDAHAPIGAGRDRWSRSGLRPVGLHIAPPRGDAYGRRSLPDRPPLPGTTARDALVATSAPATGDGHTRTLTTTVAP